MFKYEIDGCLFYFKCLSLQWKVCLGTLYADCPFTLIGIKEVLFQQSSETMTQNLNSSNVLN